MTIEDKRKAQGNKKSLIAMTSKREKSSSAKRTHMIREDLAARGRRQRGFLPDCHSAAEVGENTAP